jgi:hypothetical protein
MRTFIVAMSLATLAGAPLGAQAIPVVEQIPISASGPAPHSGSAFPFRHSYGSGLRSRLTILVDSQIAWATTFDSLDVPGVRQGRVLGTIRCDEVRSIEVLRNERRRRGGRVLARWS